jgi:hypothetical protein
VEDLVRHEREEIEVRIARGERPRRNDERGTRTVLEASPAAGREVEQELVRFVRKVPTEKRRLLSDDCLRIVHESPNVGLRDRIGWPDRIPVRLSEHLEAFVPVSPELDGRVDERVEVRRVEPVNGGAARFSGASS